MKAYVTYTLTEDNKIDIAYEATTDAPTVINMTNHSYFNLAGDPANHAVTEDVLYVNATCYTPVDDTYMTTGEIVPVAGTPFDFTTAHAIGDQIAADDEQIRNGNGYDHNYAIRTDLIYNVRGIPSIYLLDAEKTVLMKDATPERVLTALANL